jgi:hypothetical protein
MGRGSPCAWMFLFQSGHISELKEALSAGLPIYFAAIAISLVLVILAALPPSALPTSLGGFVASRRREVALVGGAVCLSAAIVLGIVFWTL